MAIELASIQLNRVHKIDTLEQAAVVYHRVPGLEGDVTQNLGRDSVRLQIEGIFYGASASTDLEKLRKAYKEREPVDFLADIVGQAYFSQVVLEQFEVLQAAQFPEQFGYRLTITEYVPPQRSARTDNAAVNRAIQTQAQSLMAVATLPDALSLGSIPELTNPAAPLTEALGQITTATEGLPVVTAGLGAIFGVQAESGPAPELANDVGVPPATALTWEAPTPEDLLAAGVSVAALLAGGMSAEALLAAGISAETLLAAGASTGALLSAGASTEELLAAGASPGALLSAGVEAESLLDAGVTDEDLATAERTDWVEITLLDDAGNPVADELYRLTLSDGTLIQEGQLDEHGQARVDEIRAEGYLISFPNLDADDWQLPTAETPAPPTTGTTTAWLAFELTDENGNPAVGTRYVISRGEEPLSEDVLDAQGQARVEGLEAGTYSLSFPELDADDWQLPTAESVELPTEPEILETPTAEDETAEDETAWIAFSLIDEAGNPIANEPFQITLPDRTTQTNQLDAQGQARIRGIAAGTYTLTFLNLDASEWDFTTAEPTETPPEERAPASPPTLIGETLPETPSPTTVASWAAFALADEAGNLLANQPYQITLPDGAMREGHLDEQGQARIEDITAGTYTVTLPNLDASEWEVATVTTPETSLEATTPIETLPDTGISEPSPIVETTSDTTAWVVLALVDDAGNPPANQTYRLTSPDGSVQTGQLDSQGETRIEGISAGTYTLTFPNLNADDWQVTADSAEISSAEVTTAAPPLSESLPGLSPEIPLKHPQM